MSRLSIAIEADDEHGLYIASVCLDDERTIIGAISMMAATLDEEVFEDFQALCIKSMKTLAEEAGLTIEQYSIRNL